MMDDTEAFNDFIANTSGDLFADDDDDDFLNEDYYNENKNNLTNVSLLAKKNAKHGPFSTSTFWMRSDNSKYDIKNHLWDFMIYNNIREHVFNNYTNKIEMMNSELLLNMVNCKRVLLSLPNHMNNEFNDTTNEDKDNRNGNKGQLDNSYLDDVEDCFDYFVRELLKGYNIKLKQEDLEDKLGGFKEINNYNWNRSTNKKMTIKKKKVEEYVGTHKSVQQLCVQARQYRKNKNELVKNTLFELLKSFNEFRYKILQEVFQESRNSRMSLTRFVKNLDKVSSRFDFFGEYRFHNIRTYLRNKEQLDNYIENYVAFNEFKNDYTEFVNTFNPNYSKDTYYIRYNNDDKNTSNKDNMDEDKDNTSSNKGLDTDKEPIKEDIDDIFDFMGGVQSQNYIQTQDMEGDNRNQDKDSNMSLRVDIDTPTNKDNNNNNSNNKDIYDLSTKSDEAEDLKLLEEARKKAAEILRLKRSQRMQTQ